MTVISNDVALSDNESFVVVGAQMGCVPIFIYNLYDFVICNTKRHWAAMQNHKQPYYVKWGTDINIFKPNLKEHKDIIFFHSMGMSFRKGTKTLIE